MKSFSLEGENRVVIDKVAMICLALLLDQASNVINQIGASFISEDYMVASSILGNLFIPFVALGLGMGEALLVLLLKMSTAKKQDEILDGAFSLCLGGAIALGLFLPLFENTYLFHFHLDHLNDAHLVYNLFVASAVVAAVNNFFYFALLVIGRRGLFIRWELFRVLFILAGTFASLVFLNRPPEKFLGLILVNLLEGLIYFGASLWIFRTRIRVSSKNFLNFWKAGKNIVWHEWLNTMMSSGSPIIFTLILVTTGSQDAVAAYCVGLSLLRIGSIPLSAISVAGTNWLSSIWDFRHTPDWDTRLDQIRTLARYAGASLFVLTACVPLILSFLYGIKTLPLMATVGVITASCFPTIFVTHLICHFRAYGKQKTIAMGNLLATYLLAVPLVVALVQSGWALTGAALATLLPASLFSLWMAQEARPPLQLASVPERDSPYQEFYWRNNRSQSERLPPQNL